MNTSPAVAATLQDLVVEGTLTADQAERVAQRLITAPDTPADPVPDAPAAPALRTSGRLAEIAGYAGGALLLGATALFLASGWQDLSDTSRVVILTGTAVLLLVVGGLIALSGGSVRALGRVHDSARRRLVSVLWTFAAGTAAGAAALSFDNHDYEFVHGLIAASAAGLLVAGVCYALVPSAVGQLGVYAGSIALLCGLILQIGDDPGTTPYAVALLVLGGLWAALAVSDVLREREPGLALGAGLALFAAQLPVISYEADELGYALTAAVAVAGFAGYLSTRSWSVLAAGVLATTLVVPEALHDWTGGSLPAAGLLLIAGLTLLGASAIGLRLRREVS
jgi:hypothetical protein